MIGRVPAGLHAPVPADYRRRDRDRLEEHHHVPGADRLRARRDQRGPVCLARRPPQRGPQVIHPDRDHPRPAQPRRPPADTGGSSTGGKQHGRVQRHEVLPGEKGVSTSSLTASPS